MASKGDAIVTAYDDAMRIVCEVVQSQMMWRSPAMLKTDLFKAIALLGEPCEKCGEPLTWTATAPVANAPMEWRCVNHANLGQVGQAPAPAECRHQYWDLGRCAHCLKTQYEIDSETGTR